MPAAPAGFTGRDAEVRELLSALDPAVGQGDGSVVVSVVTGLGGVGKTALALHIAHVAWERGWFAGGALFVNLHGYDNLPTTADHAVLSLLRALGVRDSDLPPTSDERYALYRSELSRRKPVLIVLDNASDPAQVARLLPGRAGHRLVVTSRDALDSLPARQFAVDVLTPEAACSLIERALRQAAPADRHVAAEPDAIRELAELCGHLPLALLIVSAMLRRRRTRSAATLAAELRKATDRVHRLRTPGVDQYDRELDLRPVFDVMYARLEPEQARVFRLLGQVPGEDIGLGVAANLANLRASELEPILDDLTATSLITPFVPFASVDVRWRMHDLLRLYTRAVVTEDPQLHEEATAARRRLLAFYAQAALSAAAHLNGEEPDGVPDMFPRGRTQALSWCDSERSGMLVASLWTESSDDVEATRAVRLASVLRTYLRWCRAFDHLVIMSHGAITAARRLDDLASEAMAWSGLGITLGNLGRFDEALKANHRAERLFDRLGDRKGQARALKDMAREQSALERFEEAIGTYTRSLQTSDDVGDRLGAALVRRDLGDLLGRLGRHREAYEYLTQSREYWIEAGDKSGEACIHHDLGHALRQFGRFEEAFVAYTHALGLNAELAEWDERAWGLNKLGELLRIMGRLDGSVVAHTRASDWFAFLGDSHAEAWSQLGLGTTLLTVGRIEDAREAALHARCLYEAGGRWSGVGDTLQCIALTYASQLRSTEASAAWAAAAEAYERAGAGDMADEARRQAQA
ncbi:tetratricopeptide repeat protein [Streptomyces sp. NBC_01390]|uniref:tetratricopeptide repeat protein n=1 Tax=Streptomyces sp. NBC_01390 TaxID=2903850 RepID=UPI00324FBB79